MAACPEFDFVKELKTIYCTICITKEEFEKFNDYNLKPGVINFLGDPYEEKDKENDHANDAITERVEIPKIISNLKKKMKFNFDSKTHKSKIIELENKDKDKINNHEAKVEKEAAM